MPRIAEGLHRLGSELVNFYVVWDADGLTVVDAGLPGFYGGLEACLNERGHKWDDIRALVLTHAHVDHIGFAERLRTEHGVRVLVHAETATRSTCQAAHACITAQATAPAASRCTSRVTARCSSAT